MHSSNCDRSLRGSVSRRLSAHRRLLSVLRGGERLEQRLALAGDVTFENVTALLPDSDRRGAYAGAAWFDYDNDAQLDVFTANDVSLHQRLYRNRGDGTFENVTEQAGLAGGLTSAVVAGDLDNDGFQDLILGGKNPDSPADSTPLRLYRNNGNGTFSDLTEHSHLIGPETQGSAALADINGDGLLDLFIGAIGNIISIEQHDSKLFLNHGDFQFVDVTSSAGIDAGLGACANGFSDYDQDGDVDLFIANCNDVQFDLTPIQLYRNDGSGHFEDVTAAAGLDVGGFWMGLSFADFENDGDIDFFATNFGPTPNVFYRHGMFRNNGDGTFTDIASETKVADWEFAWGTSFTDFNNDGFPDLFFAGECTFFDSTDNPGRFFYNQLGEDPAVPSFREASAILGIDLSGRPASGVAYGDFNRDGFSDIFVVTRSGRTPTPMLLKNSGNENHWLGVHLQGTASNRDAVGARVVLEAPSINQTKEIYAGTSFASMDSQSLRFGLGNQTEVHRVRVFWPSGLEEAFAVTGGVDQILSLVEGQGMSVDPVPGDTNGDRIVDLVDLNNVRNNFGASGDDVLGDADGNGAVDLEDLNAVRNNFGASFPSPFSESSPSTQRLGVNAERALDRNAADAVFGQLLATYQERDGSSPLGSWRQTRANLPRFMRP